MPSSELQKVTSKDGDVERTDYVDQNGAVTFATDKRYATVIKTKRGDTVLEEYFDEAGIPAMQSSGHYALLREYDGQGRNYRITYLGSDGRPTINTSGYSILMRAYNSDNTVACEHYYDTEGQPTPAKNGSYGRRNGYANGRNNVITYLGKNDEPAMTTSGYAILKLNFYEEGDAAGKRESELYFDEKEAPVALSIGQYGLHREYDDLGRLAVLTYLGADGKPMVTKPGYTTVKRTFYADNSIECEFYFDLAGNPMPLSRGQYGIRRVEGQTVYLDADGREMFDLNNYLHSHPTSVAVIGLLIVIVSALIGRKGNAVLLVFYLVFILYMTVMYRDDGEMRANLQLFWSYRQFFSSPELRLEILNNIWLFIPLGTILYKLCPSLWMLVLIVLLSGVIEAVQYFTGIGLAEFDDIVSNGLGGLIGFAAGYTAARLASKRKIVKA